MSLTDSDPSVQFPLVGTHTVPLAKDLSLNRLFLNVIEYSNYNLVSISTSNKLGFMVRMRDIIDWYSLKFLP